MVYIPSVVIEIPTEEPKKIFTNVIISSKADYIIKQLEKYEKKTVKFEPKSDVLEHHDNQDSIKIYNEVITKIAKTSNTRGFVDPISFLNVTPEMLDKQSNGWKRIVEKLIKEERILDTDDELETIVSEDNNVKLEVRKYSDKVKSTRYDYCKFGMTNDDAVFLTSYATAKFIFEEFLTGFKLVKAPIKNLRTVIPSLANILKDVYTGSVLCVGEGTWDMNIEMLLNSVLYRMRRWGQFDDVSCVIYAYLIMIMMSADKVDKTIFDADGDDDILMSNDKGEPTLYFSKIDNEPYLIPSSNTINTVLLQICLHRMVGKVVIIDRVVTKMEELFPLENDEKLIIKDSVLADPVYRILSTVVKEKRTIQTSTFSDMAYLMFNVSKKPKDG